jgi:putative spermidine/putrescine transport system ATP-binding protein
LSDEDGGQSPKKCRFPLKGLTGGPYSQYALAVPVELSSLTKRFGDVRAVDGVDLTIADGEFFSMLGPSGSGKTTVLRLIAGFEVPTSGKVLVNGVDVTDTPAYRRDVNTVFQDYALFPHMTVRRNVEYGLRVARVPKEQRHRRAEEALASVRMTGFEDRKPSMLSGGQRQRVALARALVNRPSLLLLDEPLGALDLKLREEMQVELKAIQRDVGVTFVFVTHDQEEALTLSDRVAVFHQGRIEQVGRPSELYEHPATAFVASFVGTSNLLEDAAARSLLGKAGTFGIRPEKLRLVDAAMTAARDESHADGVVREVIYAGPATRFHVDLDAGGVLIAVQQNLETTSAQVAELRGTRVRLVWKNHHVYPVAAGQPSA